MNLHMYYANRDLPDLVPGCCMGSAVYGPGGCTCWAEHLDREQEPIKPGPMVPREEMCIDCAFRPGSPERRGEDGYNHNTDEDREALFDPGHVFVCHQGMAKVEKLTHPQSDVEVPGHPASYRPPEVDGVCYKADGTPAAICAGWAARKKLVDPRIDEYSALPS